jgi:hypothetical protein
LAGGLIGHRELVERLAACAGRRGMPSARQAVRFADGRAGSVGESRSRVAMARAWLPAPELQWSVIDAQGRLLGRADFALPIDRVLGEFDGRVKYGRMLRPGQEPGDAVFEEKRREDALRDAGWEVVRWTWGELDAFDAVALRWRRAIARKRRAGGRS